jgi:glutamate dehydrogenase/leucine dehydrogenase
MKQPLRLCFHSLGSIFLQGGIIVGVSSSETAVMNEAGLDVKALRAHMAQGKYLAECSGGTGEQCCQARLQQGFQQVTFRFCMH